MAASDAQIFPVNGLSCRVGVRFKNTSTGNIITSWTGATTVIVTDGVVQSSPPTPVEVASTGIGYIDIPLAMMSGNMVQIHCAVTNTNAASFDLDVYTANTSCIAGRPTRLEQWITHATRRWINARQEIPINTQTGQPQTTLTVFQDSPNSSVPLYAGTVTYDGSTTRGGQLN